MVRVKSLLWEVVSLSLKLTTALCLKNYNAEQFRYRFRFRFRFRYALSFGFGFGIGSDWTEISVFRFRFKFSFRSITTCNVFISSSTILCESVLQTYEHWLTFPTLHIKFIQIFIKIITTVSNAQLNGSRFDKFVVTFLHKTTWFYKFLIFALI